MITPMVLGTRIAEDSIPLNRLKLDQFGPVPLGEGDDKTSVFALPPEFTPLMVFANGLILRKDVDWKDLGHAVSFTTPPMTGETLLAQGAKIGQPAAKGASITQAIAQSVPDLTESFRAEPPPAWAGLTVMVI